MVRAGIVLLWIGIASSASAQESRDAAPPLVQNVPPPPVVQNVPPPPVVQNVPPPPVVQNVAPAPPSLNAAPAPVVQNAAPAPMAPLPDLQEEERRSGKLFLSALGCFVLSYGLTVLAGAIRTAVDDPAGPDLYIPIVGPAVFWDRTNMTVDGETGAYLILSILAQTAGFLGTIFGIFEIAASNPE